MKVHTPAGRVVHILREVTDLYGPVTLCNRTLPRDYSEADDRVPVTCKRCAAKASAL